MNDSEKRFFYLALFLFALGGISRFGMFNELSNFESISLPINYEYNVAVNNIENLDTIAKTISDSSTENNELLKENSETSNNSTGKKAKTPKKKAPDFPISINTASKEDLCFIKGVGPSLAQKIIEHREKKGAFRSAKDLEKVSGIGAKKRKAIEEFVKFE